MVTDKEIKEKVAKELHKLDAKSENVTPPKWEALPEWAQNTYLEWATIASSLYLSYFNEIVEGLKLLDKRKILAMASDIEIMKLPGTDNIAKALREHLQAQLKSCQEQLREKLGGDS